jgi:hypothetical protein
LATFAQWSKALGKDGAQPRRITWLYGSAVLREEAISRIRDVIPPGSYTAVTAGTVPLQAVWDACLQLPAPGEDRLVVVRSAQQVKSWAPLAALVAARDTAGLWLVFSADEDDCYQRKAGKVAIADGKKALLPGPAAVSALSSGQLVRCALSSQASQIAWVQSRIPGLPATVAWRIIDRTGADMALAASVCAQLAFWEPAGRTEQAVCALVPQEPAEEFAEAVVKDEKAAAVLAVPAGDEVGSVLGQLGYLLDHLATLYSASLQQLSLRDTVKLGVPQVVAVRYRKMASRYPPQRILACRALLADADAAWRSGVREGVPEVVAALW